MAKKMTTQQVLSIVETEDLDNLIGTMESEVLEFKGDLYQLDSTKEKLELAKDVSALANLSGGIIIIGVRTSFKEEHPYETIDEIRAFEEGKINIRQYEDVIRNWIYPNLNTVIKWAPSSAESRKGIAYILVPESEITKKPFLVVKVLEENDKVLGNVVGFFQRKGDKVIHWSIEELHHALKDGLRFDDHLSEIDETLGKILSQSKTGKPHGVAAESVNRRIESAIEAVGLADSIPYVIVVYPDADLEITGLFESRTSGIVKLLDEPTKLRYAGFDLTTEQRSKIINGELRRSVLKSYKLLEVWRDGTIIFVADGDEGFLCWGNYPKEELLRINTIALVESVYLFTLFTKIVYEKTNLIDCEIQARLYLKRIPSEKKYVLPKSLPGSRRWYANLDSVAATFRELVVNKKLNLGKTSAEALAYQIVAHFYEKFGVEHEFIPYVKDEGGEKAIDVEKIRNIK